RAEEVERRAHIELAGVRAPHQREIDGRAARMAGALGNIALLEQVALVRVRVEFTLALDVVDPLRPAHELRDRALRPVAIEHFEAKSARRQIALDRGPPRDALVSPAADATISRIVAGRPMP